MFGEVVKEITLRVMIVGVPALFLARTWTKKRRQKFLNPTFAKMVPQQSLAFDMLPQRRRE